MKRNSELRIVRDFPQVDMPASHTHTLSLSFYLSTYLSLSFFFFLFPDARLLLARFDRSNRSARVIVMQMIFAQAKNRLGEAKRAVRLQKRILHAATRMGKSAGASRHLLELRSAAISDFLCNYAAP